MKRTLYFQKVNFVNSPLLLLPDYANTIISSIANDLAESVDTYLSFTDKLLKLNNDAAKTRASFIKCNVKI